MSRSQKNSKQRGRRSLQIQSDEEDVDLSQSQRRKSKALSQEKKSILITEMCRFIIQSWNGVPMKKTDFTKHVLGEDSRSFSIILPKVKEELRRVFGLDLTEIKPSVYVITNCLKSLENDKSDEEYDSSQLGLTHLILSIVYMSDGSILEEKLLENLSFFQISAEADVIFGNVRKLIVQDLVRQGYLASSTIDGDTPKIMLEWGTRAHKEISKRDVVEFVAEVYNCQPEAFAMYKKVLKEEEEMDCSQTMVPASQEH